MIKDELENCTERSLYYRWRWDNPYYRNIVGVNVFIQILFIIIISIIGGCVIYFEWKKDREKERTQRKEKFKEQRRIERVYRPIIYFRIVDDEFQVIGENKARSHVFIENLHYTKIAKDVEIMPMKDKKATEFICDKTSPLEIPPRGHLSFSSQNLFPDVGEYTLVIFYKSEYGHIYMTTAIVSHVTEGWEYWVPPSENPKTWIKKGGKWQNIPK